MKWFKAIAAMSLNRVIGRDNQLPWHLPDDFKWFRQVTVGNVVVMGRKTFESLGRPLPGRTTVVLTRSPAAWPGVVVASDLSQVKVPDDRDVFICGGAQVYARALPQCSELYLTLVKQVVEGDAFFPPFEDRFELVAVLCDRPGFQILHYRNKATGE